MTTFMTPIAHGAGLQRVMPSAAAPALRYKDDPLMWIGVPAGMAINAFATGSIARRQGRAVVCQGMRRVLDTLPALAAAADEACGVQTDSGWIATPTGDRDR